MNDHVNGTMAGILNSFVPKENAPPSVHVQAVVGPAGKGVFPMGTEASQSPGCAICQHDMINGPCPPDCRTPSWNHWISRANKR